MKFLRVAAIFLAASSLGLAATPVIPAGGVVNGADYTETFSPGILFSVFGTDLAAATKKAPGFPLPDTIDGVSVEVNDGTKTLKAPLFFVSAGQINALLPFEITGSTVGVRVKNAQGTSNTATIPIIPGAPRLLTKTMDGKGEAILTHADYTLVSEQSPAKAGEVVILYLTGLGAVNPVLASGQMAGDGSASKPLNYVKADVVVNVNGNPAKVYFAGLAPYFAGLYQLNFQVPEQTEPGYAEISVETAWEASQRFVQLACAIRWEALGAAAVSSGGGTASAAGLTLTIPTGVFTGERQVRIFRAVTGVPSEPARTGTVYGISGLPATFSSPLNVSVDIPGASAVAGGAYVILRQLGSQGGEMCLKATVEGDRVKATIPARPAAVKQATPVRMLAPEPDPAEVLILSIILGTNEWLSEKAQFHVIYENRMTEEQKATDKKYVDALLWTLDAAYEKLQARGFVWAAGWPVEVRLGDKNNADRFCGGRLVAGIWSTPPGLRIGDDMMKQAIWETAENQPWFRAKAGHLLFHLIQSQYWPNIDPASHKSWIWMDEAAAFALERDFDDYYHDKFRDTYSPKLPINGLELAARSDNAFELFAHGYDAASFLMTLKMRFEKQPTWLANVYNRKKGSAEVPLPVKAMQDVGINVSQEWRSDVSFASFIDGVEHPRDYDFGSARTRTLEGAVNKPVTFSWNAPDLSGQFFKLILPSAWPANADLSVSLGESAPDTLEIILYKIKGVDNPQDQLAYELMRGKNLLIKSPASVFAAGDFLGVVAINARAVDPFKTITPIGVTAYLKGGFDLLKAIQAAPYVSARLSANATCNIYDYDYTQKPPKQLKPTTSACSPWFVGNLINGTLYRPTWSADGRTFTVSAKNTSGDATYQRTVELTMKATYYEEDKSLRDGEIRMDTTNVSLSVKPNITAIDTSMFKFSRIPLLSQDHENLTGPWMFQHVVASLPQTVFREALYLKTQDGLVMEELKTIDFLNANGWVSFKTQP